jgi:hypothetical protein
MSNTNTGGPAFPGVEYKQPGGAGVSVMTIVGGMTLRDYFAAKAMQSILPSYQNVFDDETGSDDDPTFPELLAKDAYVMADAMLKVREA